jgi:hypothetical protein
MTQVGFEPTIPVFEQAKTVHALHSAGTVIGYVQFWVPIMKNKNYPIFPDVCRRGGPEIRPLHRDLQ